jgi:histidinol phosphatase-like PHP family hydrolase
MSPTNVDIAELLARAAETADGHRARAYRTASVAALMWSEEAADLVAADRSLTELERIGPSLARRVRGWIEDPPEIPSPPPARAGFGSFAGAISRIARELAWGAPRGDLQMHTTFSDGKVTLEQMALTGIELGYRYVAITDHSKGLRIANGIDEATLGAQGEQIEAFNDKLAADGLDFRVLRSVEMNLDTAGAGDMDAEALGKLDLVLGSFHSALRSTEDETNRYLAAVRNPHVDVIGHPRGRKYNLRLGLQADWTRVLEAAAAHGKAMEINAYPNRQDLSVDLLEIAREAGGWVSIGTDAHDPTEMRFLPVGIAAALDAGIPRDRILNFLERDELVAWVAARRGRAQS